MGRVRVYEVVNEFGVVVNRYGQSGFELAVDEARAVRGYVVVKEYEVGDDGG